MSSKFSFKSVGSGLAFYAPIIYAALFLIASLMFHSLVYYKRTATLLILTSIVNIVRVVFMPQYRQPVGCVIKSSWLESHNPQPLIQMIVAGLLFLSSICYSLDDYCGYTIIVIVIAALNFYLKIQGYRVRKNTTNDQVSSLSSVAAMSQSADSASKQEINQGVAPQSPVMVQSAPDNSTKKALVIIGAVVVGIILILAVRAAFINASIDRAYENASREIKKEHNRAKRDLERERRQLEYDFDF